MIASSALRFAATACCLIELCGCRSTAELEAERFVPPPSALASEDARRAAEEADALWRSPRTEERVQRSYERALDANAEATGHQGLIQAARACAWLSDNALVETNRKVHALRGAAMAREAERRLPGRVEPPYYLALNLASLSELYLTPRHLEEMAQRAQESIQRDEKFDRAGPHRYLGLLHLRTQGRLLVGFGDLDLALKHLGRAVELFPEDAENRVAFAEALLADDDADGARRELEAAGKSPPPADFEEKHQVWVRRAEEMLRGLPKPAAAQ